MRPLRFLLVLAIFVVLPIVLTCVSLFSSEKRNPETLDVGYRTRGRFRALFSFTTPSSLFPPSAIISLTDDNTTSFLARPAAFGPSLPAQGLSGQLWVGKGFGENTLISEEALRHGGFELGCSDVPGWGIDHRSRTDDGAAVDVKSTKNKVDNSKPRAEAKSGSTPSKRDVEFTDEEGNPAVVDDGTDDHLHHPLPDSNPASPEKPGEPASNSNQDKSKPPVHADIESLQESADIAGKIVMLSRGGCGFLEKTKWAQRRGGVAVIVGDNEPGGPLIVMYAKGDISNITIPAIFTSYYSAQLLSTLVPSTETLEIGSDGRPLSVKDGKSKSKEIGGDKKSSSVRKPASGKDKADTSSESKTDKGWVQNVLSAVGLDDDASIHGEDSRRPPGSGNIDWVLLEDWDEEQPATTIARPQTQKTIKASTLTTKALKAKVTSKKLGNDDFIIGVQDWRDTELIAPKSTAAHGTNKQKGKVDATAIQASTSTSSANPKATALKGGSITPGSGEYDHEKDEMVGKGKQSKVDQSEKETNHVKSEDHRSFSEKIAAFFSGEHKEIVHPRPEEYFPIYGKRPGRNHQDEREHHKLNDHEGLWVTLTPTNVSTSPFFDTLLVLVVSPLVTLTFVYGLLLLRSRIRRRRWRAPKSVVERLPIRTYHTMSATSSTTSSTLSSPHASSQNLSNLRPTSHTRVRPRSQTTTGVLSTSAPVEKSNKSPPKRKRYTGRQVECVVCLEEYVDGESQVMSLPCGHEFHAECITPWLVTRRRTCPICKGDVVRSLNRSGGDSSSTADDAVEPDEQTSDDVQERVATTQNRDSSAAIPIPVVTDSGDNDVERGSSVDTPLLGTTPRAQQNRWRGIINSSIGRLSGDTVWRSNTPSVNDRNR